MIDLTPLTFVTEKDGDTLLVTGNMSVCEDRLANTVRIPVVSSEDTQYDLRKRAEYTVACQIWDSIYGQLARQIYQLQAEVLCAVPKSKVSEVEDSFRRVTDQLAVARGPSGTDDAAPVGSGPSLGVWLPIETAPIKTPILIYDQCAGVMEAYWDGIWAGSMTRYPCPTHWMPLPSSPDTFKGIVSRMMTTPVGSSDLAGQAISEQQQLRELCQCAAKTLSNMATISTLEPSAKRLIETVAGALQDGSNLKITP